MQPFSLLHRHLRAQRVRQVGADRVHHRAVQADAGGNHIAALQMPAATADIADDAAGLLDQQRPGRKVPFRQSKLCLLYTSDAADDRT